MSRDSREKFIDEALSNLESECKPALSQENLVKANAFEKALLGIRTIETISDEWYDELFRKYSGASYIDRLIFKMKV
jgi:hypothetical protein